MTDSIELAGRWIRAALLAAYECGRGQAAADLRQIADSTRETYVRDAFKQAARIAEGSTGAAPGSPLRAQVEPERVAVMFHETYERLAPQFGYRTREASAKPWEQVPESNRALMVATCAEVLNALAASATEPLPLGEPACNKPDWPLFEALRPVDLWLGPLRRDTVRLADLDLRQDG